MRYDVLDIIGKKILYGINRFFKGQYNFKSTVQLPETISIVGFKTFGKFLSQTWNSYFYNFPKQKISYLIYHTSYIILLSSCDKSGILHEVSESDLNNTNKWRKTFAEECNGISLDKSKWTVSYADGETTNRNNANDCYYTESAIGFKEGIMTFTAAYDPKQYKYSSEGHPTLDDGILNYSSALISSHDKFSQQEGFFETRLKMPKGKGIWPTFWLMPANTSKEIFWLPEIDIMEYFGGDSLIMNNYWWENNQLQRWENYVLFQNDGQFHTYGLHWQETQIDFYVDGKIRSFSRIGLPKEKMYIILNLAIGGHNRYPDKNTQFPAKMEVDYVRVYEKN